MLTLISIDDNKILASRPNELNFNINLCNTENTVAKYIITFNIAGKDGWKSLNTINTPYECLPAIYCTNIYNLKGKCTVNTFVSTNEFLFTVIVNPDTSCDLKFEFSNHLSYINKKYYFRYNCFKNVTDDIILLNSIYFGVFNSQSELDLNSIKNMMCSNMDEIKKQKALGLSTEQFCQIFRKLFQEKIKNSDCASAHNLKLLLHHKKTDFHIYSTDIKIVSRPKKVTVPTIIPAIHKAPNLSSISKIVKPNKTKKVFKSFTLDDVMN